MTARDACSQGEITGALPEIVWHELTHRLMLSEAIDEARLISCAERSRTGGPTRLSLPVEGAYPLRHDVFGSLTCFTARRCCWTRDSPCRAAYGCSPMIHSFWRRPFDWRPTAWCRATRHFRPSKRYPLSHLTTFATSKSFACPSVVAIRPNAPARPVCRLNRPPTVLVVRAVELAEDASHPLNCRSLPCRSILRRRCARHCPRRASSSFRTPGSPAMLATGSPVSRG